LAPNASQLRGRFINRDGTFNLPERGYFLFEQVQHLSSFADPAPLEIRRAVIVLFYLSFNLLYTMIYLLIGIDQLQGSSPPLPGGNSRKLIFSARETFTTVGYGRVNPVGDGANFVASIEAMTGFLSLPSLQVLCLEGCPAPGLPRL